MPNLRRVILRAPLSVVAWTLLLLVGLASQPRGRRMRRWRKHKDAGSRITAIGVEAGARSEMPADPVDPRFRRDGRVYQAERPRGAVASRSLSRCRTQQNAERARNGYKSQASAPRQRNLANAIHAISMHIQIRAVDAVIDKLDKLIPG